MPFILNKYPSYDAFGSAYLDDILKDTDAKKSVFRSISTFSSIALINRGELQFDLIELPVDCQTGPIKAIVEGDFNKDGARDFIYAGNHYPTEVETARYDALQPGIAYGDGTGEYKCVHLYNNSVPVTGDFRDIKIIETQAGKIAILTRNDGNVEVISL